MSVVLPKDFNKHVLISGSRDSTPEMRLFAFKAVECIHENGWTLIVGDAPGIDTAAVMHAMTLGCPFLVYHTDALRIPNVPVGSIINCHGMTYTERDEAMVRDAGIVFCIWNGSSKGTKHVFDYASRWEREHKLVYIKTF